MTKTRRNCQRSGLPISTTDWRAMTDRDRYILLTMLSCNPPPEVAAERFDVSKRTIQLWRHRLGLPTLRAREPIMTAGEFRAISIKPPVTPNSRIYVDVGGVIYPVVGREIDVGTNGECPVARIILKLPEQDLGDESV